MKGQAPGPHIRDVWGAQQGTVGQLGPGIWSQLTY